MSYTPIGFNENKVITFKRDDVEIHNPFEIALQAMIGKDVFNVYEKSDGNLIPRYYPIRYLPNPRYDEYALKAMEWIINNERKNDKYGFWDYKYDIYYNDEHISSPWISAFGQSYIILASLLWYKCTKEDMYKRIAIRAINGLLLPVDKGGTVYQFDNGIWFEEVPSQKSTHIFNAHLIALIALCEARETLGADIEVDSWIEEGIRGFRYNCDHIDTGNWSAYDIPYHIDLMLQLVPVDAGRTIKVKNICLEDQLKEKREIKLDKDDCFQPNKQWIAGIDWGNVNEKGYREIKYGMSIHPEPVPTGDRQNTFMYFKNVSAYKSNITLDFMIDSEYETELSLFRQDYKGIMVPLGFLNKLYISKGENTYKISIPSSALGSPLSEVYHKYHILLLEELNRLTNISELTQLIKKFRSYLSEKKQTEKNYNVPLNLTSLYVSVNEECGLSCKMCDFGLKNKESSLYKNLKPSNHNEEFDSELFLERCRDAKDLLKLVHFIGTEPTLYKKLPYLVSELKKMDLKVLVTTNGVNLRKSLPELLDAGLDELWISIDGPSHIHNFIRGRHNLFENIQDCILENKDRILREKNKRGFALNIACAITPMNYEYLSELILDSCNLPIDCYWFTHMNYIKEDIAKEQCVKFPHHKIYASCTHPDMNADLTNTYIMWKSNMEIVKLGKKLDKRVAIVPNMTDFLDFEDYYKRPNINIMKTKCSVPYTSMEINSDGSVCVMARCYQFDIGNIKNKSIVDIFNSLPLIKFRDDIEKHGLYKPCYRCCGIME